MIDVAISVVFGQDLYSLFGTILGNKPSRRLWEEHDNNHDDCWHTALDEGRHSPCPGIVEVQVGAVGSPSSPITVRDELLNRPGSDSQDIS